MCPGLAIVTFGYIRETAVWYGLGHSWGRRGELSR